MFNKRILTIAIAGLLGPALVSAAGGYTKPSSAKKVASATQAKPSKKYSASQKASDAAAEQLKVSGNISYSSRDADGLDAGTTTKTLRAAEYSDVRSLDAHVDFNAGGSVNIMDHNVTAKGHVRVATTNGIDVQDQQGRVDARSASSNKPLGSSSTATDNDRGLDVSHASFSMGTDFSSVNLGLEFGRFSSPANKHIGHDLLQKRGLGNIESALAPLATSAVDGQLKNQFGTWNDGDSQLGYALSLSSEMSGVNISADYGKFFGDQASQAVNEKSTQWHVGLGYAPSVLEGLSLNFDYTDNNNPLVRTSYNDASSGAAATTTAGFVDKADTTAWKLGAEFKGFKAHYGKAERKNGQTTVTMTDTGTTAVSGAVAGAFYGKKAESKEIGFGYGMELSGLNVGFEYDQQTSEFMANNSSDAEISSYVLSVGSGDFKLSYEHSDIDVTKGTGIDPTITAAAATGVAGTFVYGTDSVGQLVVGASDKLASTTAKVSTDASTIRFSYNFG